MILFFFALLLGMINGVLSGLFGLGGGILVVPIISTYISYLGLPQYSMSIAVATSLCSIIVTLSLSAFQHHQSGNLPLKFALKLIIPSIFGAILGSYLDVSADLSRLIFGCFLMFAAMQMYFSTNKQKQQESESSKDTNNKNNHHHTLIQKYSLYIILITVFALSLLSSIIGVGGGSLLVPILLALGWQIRNVIATSAFLGLIIGIVATITKIIHLPEIKITTELQQFYESQNLWLLGHIHIIWLSGLIIGALCTSKFGVGLSNKLPVIQLKQYFVILLLIISSYMIYRGGISLIDIFPNSGYLYQLLNYCKN